MSSARSRKFVIAAGWPAVAAKAAAKATVAEAPRAPSYWLPTTTGTWRARHGSRIRHDAVEDACAARGFKPVAAHEVAETATLVSFVAAGLGVSLVPASVQNMTVRGAVYRPLTQAATRVELAVAWRGGDERPVLARALAVVRANFHGI